jgi:hypothetical protein
VLHHLLSGGQDMHGSCHRCQRVVLHGSGGWDVGTTRWLGNLRPMQCCTMEGGGSLQN